MHMEIRHTLYRSFIVQCHYYCRIHSNAMQPQHHIPNQINKFSNNFKQEASNRITDIDRLIQDIVALCVRNKEFSEYKALFRFL